MVAPHGGIRATIPVTLEVTRHAWRLLGTPKGHSEISEIVQACSHGGCLLGPGLAEVAGLDQLWRKLLAQVCSGGGC